MITNLVRDGQPRVRLVLAGSPALEERFASPKLDSFSQRLAARCYLAALNREETTHYARFQISVVGGDPDRVFDGSAYESIYRATDGIPRLINQVCDHALILTALGECRTVTAAAIEEAWSDLQQLPTPWQPGSNGREAAPAVVEFAPLDDLQDEASAILFPAPRARSSRRTRISNSTRSNNSWPASRKIFNRPARSGPRSSWCSIRSLTRSARRSTKRKWSSIVTRRSKPACFPSGRPSAARRGVNLPNC